MAPCHMAILYLSSPTLGSQAQSFPEAPSFEEGLKEGLDGNATVWFCFLQDSKAPNLFFCKEQKGSCVRQSSKRQQRPGLDEERLLSPRSGAAEPVATGGGQHAQSALALHTASRASAPRSRQSFIHTAQPGGGGAERERGSCDRRL